MKMRLAVIASLLLLIIACIKTKQPEDYACVVEDGIVVCGGQPCELLEPGVFNCDNGVVCRQAEEGGVECEGEEKGGTVVREPWKAPPDEAFVEGERACTVGLLLKMGIGRPNTKKTILTQNLKHGFSEVVVPLGYNLKIVKYEPVPSQTGPYKGTFSSTWTVDGNSRTASVHGNRGNIVRKFKRKRRQWRPVQGNPPSVQEHTILASWDPDDQDVCTPPVSHSFKVIFAGATPVPPELKLGDFYVRMRGADRDFPGGTGTRDLHDDPPKPRKGDDSVNVPIGIYWELGDDCCGIANATPKVIQFARAAIDGPAGRMGKPWTLDNKSSEVKKAPNHDPTYTTDPHEDRNENPYSGGGGTRMHGDDMVQWDAPGMPDSLYHRLLNAQGASTYRQQFLSLLVCRPTPGRDIMHTAGYYLNNALVKQVAVTTVTWRFPGQRGADLSDMSNFRLPQNHCNFPCPRRWMCSACRCACSKSTN